jgi:hypothetical protein
MMRAAANVFRAPSHVARTPHFIIGAQGAPTRARSLARGRPNPREERRRADAAPRRVRSPRRRDGAVRAQNGAIFPRRCDRWDTPSPVWDPRMPSACKATPARKRGASDASFSPPCSMSASSRSHPQGVVPHGALGAPRPGVITLGGGSGACVLPMLGRARRERMAVKFADCVTHASRMRVQDCACAPHRASPKLAVTPSSSLVPHALNPCRVRRAPAARVRGTANPARWVSLHSVLPLHLEKPGADFGFLLLECAVERPIPLVCARMRCIRLGAVSSLSAEGSALGPPSVEAHS